MNFLQNFDQGKYEIETEIKSLEFQRERIFSKIFLQAKERISPVHDVDFYLIILRRLYRQLEDIAATDSRVANLKGLNKDLLKRIKIRDHFEHGINFENLSPVGTREFPGVKIGSNVKISTSLLGRLIVSGDLYWDLDKDHIEFVRVINEMIAFYPFAKKNK